MSWIFGIVIFVMLLLVFYLILLGSLQDIPKSEKFSPYESTLVHDMYRSDPSGDVPSANPPARNNEEILFDQLLGWAMHP